MRLSTNERKRRQKAALYWHQSGLCYYCAVPVLLKEWPRRLRQPDHLATLEHLDHKFSPERGRHQGEYRRVLACRRCNEIKGRQDAAMLARVDLGAGAEDRGVCG